jgi:hypothetical protein
MLVLLAPYSMYLFLVVSLHSGQQGCTGVRVRGYAYGSTSTGVPVREYQYGSTSTGVPVREYQYGSTATVLLLFPG